MPRLTDKLIRTLPVPASGNRIVYDSEVKGFGVRLTYRGAVAFVLTYRTQDGIQRRLTIGSWPDWAVATARQESAKLKRAVDQGEDPLATRQAQRALPTISDLAQRYLDEHAVPHKRASSLKDDRARLRRWIEPELGERKVVSVRYADIAVLHRKITLHGTPTTANRTVALLSKMFNLAKRWEWFVGDNPCNGIIRNPETKRDRPLSRDETQRLGAALDTYPQRDAADAIALLMLTGARTSEVLQATWSQLDLDAGVWVKQAPNTKQKRLHRVPLSGTAVRLLMSRQTAAEGPYVFPGRQQGRPLTTLKRPWQALCKQAGIPSGRRDGITPHDLRHSFGSILGRDGLSLPIIGALLGHSQAATTLRYVHLNDDPLRVATERATKELTGTTTANGQ
jgi:integrase